MVIRQQATYDKPTPSGELIEGLFSYVFLPEFSGNLEQETEFISALREIVVRLDSSNPRGWIIDLRTNMGGNMWPMLVGIGPILGGGLAGTFVDPCGQKLNWYYRNGEALLEDKVLAADKEGGYVLKMQTPPAAVLTGKSTMSSGEAIMTAFRGRPNTRSFGVGTRGLSTANHPFNLSDGVKINLTVSVFADRTGQIYGGVIVPDEMVEAATTDGPIEEDLVIQAAIRWLSEQEVCTKPE